MKITIITLFPQMFTGPFDFSIIKRAIDDLYVEIDIIDLRNFGIGKHKSVDDTVYGGGVGMLIRADVVMNAIESVKDKNLNKSEEKIILTSATGKTFDQSISKEYSFLKHLIVICGHYEGIDARIKDYIDEEISIGDFVVTGGEIPAMIIVDSVIRLIPGVLKVDATNNESHTKKNILQHPQYTRPRILNKISVPEIFASGNHEEIKKWKKVNSPKKS